MALVNQVLNILVLLGALAYLTISGEAEARSLMSAADQGAMLRAAAAGIENEADQVMAKLDEANQDGRPMVSSSNLEQLDNDEDDDDDDRANFQPQQQQAAIQGAASAPMDHQNYNSAPAAAATPIGSDLKTSASYHGHHHGHGVKGWLDMGAWTGKKGAFGWHDKHPVGGKGRR